MVSKTLDLEHLEDLVDTYDKLLKPLLDLRTSKIDETHFLVYDVSELHSKRWMYPAWSRF